MLCQVSLRGDDKAHVQGRVGLEDAGHGKSPLLHQGLQLSKLEGQGNLLPGLLRQSQELKRHIVHQHLVRPLGSRPLLDGEKAVGIVVLRHIPELHMPLQELRVQHLVGEHLTGRALLYQGMGRQLLIFLHGHVLDDAVAVAP